jgi:hypothetical protein
VSFILGQGDDARKINEKKASSVKVRFLKTGQSFIGRFVTLDFVTYRQHGSFEHKIQSHACLDPKSQKACPSCAAGVPSSVKTLVFWYDIEKGEVVVRDVNKTAMNATVYPLKDEYGEDLLTDTFQITMGDKGALSIMPKKAKKGEEFAPTPESVKIDDDILNYVANYRTEDEVRELITGWKPTSSDDAPVVETTSDPTSGF